MRGIPFKFGKGPDNPKKVWPYHGRDGAAGWMRIERDTSYSKKRNMEKAFAQFVETYGHFTKDCKHVISFGSGNGITDSYLLAYPYPPSRTLLPPKFS